MVNSKTNLTLDNTCTAKGGHMKQHINIKRTGNGCNFPPELRRTWNYTYQAARYIVFSKKSANLHLLGSKAVIHFTCEGKDGNMFILRVSNATREQDGFMCWLIKKLPDDPFYSYELARLNNFALVPNTTACTFAGGTVLDGKLKLVGSAHRLNLYKDCDWFESAARSEYLYV
ncbi:hypothetical protein CHS0354_005124 [Potamilus streckersoni]|uniref:Uncharacterized protein n=1 Tax=Potamilus streckersoni TaxID=2493646 RepID=A0AAE0SI62_9BIVA|nr:hypothetical protein CHS0354_005124 [Potamilus streckersoni]